MKPCRFVYRCSDAHACQLSRMLETTAGAKIQRVFRGRGAGGGVCDAPSLIVAVPRWR